MCDYQPKAVGFGIFGLDDDEPRYVIMPAYMRHSH